MKRHIAAVLLLAATAMPTAAVAAQPQSTDEGNAAPGEGHDKIEATIGADIVNRFIWRGQDYGAVSLQPTLGVAYRGLSLTAWGSIGISDPHDDEEADLTLRYEHPCGLHVALTDYWMAYGKRSIGEGWGSDPDNRFFHFASHSTNHTFEANVGYDFGVVAIDWFTIFAGDDTRTASDRRAYSSYMEATVPFRFATCDWTATIGAVPYRTEFYDAATGFAVVNVSLMAEKAIDISRKFSLPLYAGIAANPSNRKAYMLFGLTVGI